jgi:predicted dehydrogenase
MAAGLPVLRFGVLGAARVVPYGLVQPARATAGIEVRAIASRSLARAQALAAAEGIPQAFGSYESLLDSTEIDAVYLALPPALHARWTRLALDAGKHVLCEKPLAPTASLAASLVHYARARRLVLQEGMHVQFFAALRRQRELATSGAFGRIRRIESCCRFPALPVAADDFRLRFELGGGAGLDLGCYAVSVLRHIANEEPEVIATEHRCETRDVDCWMRATLRLPSGADAVAECGFKGPYTPRFGVTVTCERGSIAWDQQGLVCTRDGYTTREPMPPTWTYQRQLQIFAARTRGAATDAWPLDDAVATARVLDAMYARAGLAPRAAEDA